MTKQRSGGSGGKADSERRVSKRTTPYSPSNASRREQQKRDGPPAARELLQQEAVIQPQAAKQKTSKKKSPSAEAPKESGGSQEAADSGMPEAVWRSLSAEDRRRMTHYVGTIKKIIVDQADLLEEAVALQATEAAKAFVKKVGALEATQRMEAWFEVLSTVGSQKLSRAASVSSLLVTGESSVVPGPLIPVFPLSARVLAQGAGGFVAASVGDKVSSVKKTKSTINGVGSFLGPDVS
jgi:hypothetical protein